MVKVDVSRNTIDIPSKLHDVFRYVDDSFSFKPVSVLTITVSYLHFTKNFSYVVHSQDTQKYITLSLLKFAQTLTFTRRSYRFKDIQTKKFYYQDKAFFRDTSGGVHLFPNNILKLQKDINIETTRCVKLPPDLTHHIGLELEFFSEWDHEDIRNKIVDMKLHKNVRLMTDNSIHGTDDKPIGGELCVLMPEVGHEDLLKKVIKLLEDIGAETNNSCGLHVHLDMRVRDLRRIYHNFVIMQDYLYKIVDPQRIQNPYCLPVLNTDINQVLNNHYHAINKAAYGKYKTLEIRMHQGTVDIEKIKNWINLLLKITNYDKLLTNSEELIPQLLPQLVTKELLEQLI